MTACGEQAQVRTKVNIRPRSSSCQGVDKDATRTLRPAERAAMSQRRTSYFGEGDVLDRDFCVCLRAVIPSCQCCCSPFFGEVVARGHWHKSQFSAYTINVWLKKSTSHTLCHLANNNNNTISPF